MLSDFGKRIFFPRGILAQAAEAKQKAKRFNATIAWALGLPLDHVITSPSKRPFTVADKGRPLTHLFA